MRTNKDSILAYTTIFGPQHSVIKMIEEMGELTQVLAKYLNNPSKVDEKLICEELAHVEVFSECLRNIFSNETINYYYNERVKRLRAKVIAYTYSTEKY